MKIKTGRYPGQPEWMPDCEIWKDDNCDIAYKIDINSKNVLVHTNKKDMIYSKKNFEYLFTPVYKQKKRRQDDVCVCWNNGDIFVKIMWYRDIKEWDHVIIMPEEYVGTRISYGVKFWEKVNAEVIR